MSSASSSSTSAPSPPPPPTTNTKSKVTLTGTEETLFVTLYGRYFDAVSPNPILGDRHAGPILEKVDYDFAKLGVRKGTASAIAIRSLLFDTWTVEFLSRNPSATVVHIACGLDTRPHRLPWGSGVRWIDVDLPGVVELRRKLVPPPEEGNGKRDYTLLAGSAIDPDFIATLPNDRPTAVIIEGLSLYLDPADGEAMVANLCGRFPSGGVLMMDSVGWLALSLQRTMSFVRNTSSTLRWAIDDPKALERLHPGRLDLMDALPLCNVDTVARLDRVGQVFMWICSLLPATRNFIRYLRYNF